MRKICFALFWAFMLLSLFSCSKISESDAKDLAEKLIECIEQDDRAAAADLFCAREDRGETFSEFLEKTEKATGIDFSEGIEIAEYLKYSSAPNSYFGLVCGELEIKAVIDGKTVILNIQIVEYGEKLECSGFVVYDDINDKTNYYQFLCHYIEERNE